MTRLRALFSAHPASVGETYFQHLCNAACFSGRMLAAGLACFIHALLPFLFVKTGSGTIAELHDRMVVNRDSRLARNTATGSPGTNTASVA